MASLAEYVLLVVFWPLAITTYYLLTSMSLSTGFMRPAFLFPFFLCFLVGLAFLVIMPTGYLTAFALAAQLTLFTVVAFIVEFPDLFGSPVILVLLVLGFLVCWTLSIYTLLSVRGATQQNMGRLGQTADGLVKVMAGVGVIGRGIVDGIGSLGKGVVDGIGSLGKGIVDGGGLVGQAFLDGLRLIGHGIEDILGGKGPATTEAHQGEYTMEDQVQENIQVDATPTR